MKFISLILLAVTLFIAISAFPIVIRLLLITIKQPPTMVGIGVFVILYYTFLKKRISVFQTLDHELAHACLCFIFRHRITELKATDKMGGHTISYGRNNFLIWLAPYIWRMPMIITTFIIWLLNHNSVEWIYLFVFGIAFAYRNISIFEEARPYQTDLKQVGILKSYLWIVSLNIIWLGVIATAMLNSYGMEDYFSAIYNRMRSIVVGF